MLNGTIQSPVSYVIASLFIWAHVLVMMPALLDDAEHVEAPINELLRVCLNLETAWACSP